MGVAEIEESLMAEVVEVCRAYCSQVWSEALNRARVEASSTFRKEKKNVYYPPTIRAPSSLASLNDGDPNVVNPIKETLSKELLQLHSPEEVAEQAN